MNRAHLEHAAIAALIQLALWPVLGLIAAGIVPVAVLLGREIAQHEYRLAILRGWSWGRPMPVRWYEGLISGWGLDSLFDVLTPAAVCAAITTAGILL